MCALCTGASARFDVIPGSSNMSILLDNLQCLGTEASLLDCPALPVGTHNCGHYEDAGVTCLRKSHTLLGHIHSICYSLLHY